MLCPFFPGHKGDVVWATDAVGKLATEFYEYLLRSSTEVNKMCSQVRVHRIAALMSHILDFALACLTHIHVFLCTHTGEKHLKKKKDTRLPPPAKVDTQKVELFA